MDVAGSAGLMAGLLGVSLLIALAAERLRVPSEVALVAFGALTAAFHPIALPFKFGDALLFVFLPPLIFEAAWAVDAGALRRAAGRIVLLALPGVVLVAGTIGLGVAVGGSLPLASAFVLGAIVSATDPVAVIAIFRRMNVPVELLTIVEGESIANDGVAIALYTVAVGFAVDAAVQPVPLVILHVLVSIFGGCAVGVVCAVIVALIMGRTQSSSLEIAATVVLAFQSYLLANAIGVSGVFATASAALVLRGFTRIVPVTGNVDGVDTFWSAVAYIANAIVFLATGLVVQLDRIPHHPVLVLVAIAAVVLSRCVLAAIVIRPAAWRITVILAGMRGALSLALALALPDAVPFRAEIIDAVFAIVLFTLLVQGLSLEPVLAKLGFQRGSGGPSLSS